MGACCRRQALLDFYQEYKRKLQNIKQADPNARLAMNSSRMIFEIEKILTDLQ